MRLEGLHTSVVAVLAVLSRQQRAELATHPAERHAELATHPAERHAELATHPAERHAELAAHPAERHAELLAGLDLNRVEVRPPPRAEPLGASVRTVAWNVQRGNHLAASADLLEQTGADVMLISELDWGMARSGQHHTAAALADRLGCGYAYAVEYLELGLGDIEESRRHAGQQNEVGYHGNAILSRAPLARLALVRLEADGGWFDGHRGERRIGGRMAVLATIPMGGRDVVFASVHLESHSNPDQRAAQIEALLDGIESYCPGAPVLVGGDLNTFSLDPADVNDAELMRRLFDEDPGRLGHPVPHEPLFELAASRGYDWHACNVAGEPTQRVAEPQPSRRGEMKIDWFLSRGLQASQPAVLSAADPEGVALSDHEPIAVRVEL